MEATINSNNNNFFFFLMNQFYYYQKTSNYVHMNEKSTLRRTDFY